MNIQGLRKQMYRHSEDFKLNHEFQLLSAVKDLTKKSQEGEKKLEENHLEIQQLKKLNRQKDEKIDELKNDVNILKDKLENVREQLSTKIEKNEQLMEKCFARIECNERLTENRLIKIEEHQTDQVKTNDGFKKNIKNLQTFSEQVSKLHVTLSEGILRRNHHHSLTLFQEEYDKNNEVTLWNKTIEEANKDDNTCHYLKTLTESMNRYKLTIYPSTYKERFENFVYSLPEGVYFNGFFKITCLPKSLRVKLLNTSKKFQDEVERNDERRFLKVQNDPCFFSYYYGGYLNVVMWCSVKVHLLHETNEENKIKISHSEEGHVINDVSEYKYANSIVLYLSN